jgi:hypothetical protein
MCVPGRPYEREPLRTHGYFALAPPLHHSAPSTARPSSPSPPPSPLFTMAQTQNSKGDPTGDEALLASLGYKQELKRDFHGWELFGLAFSLIGASRMPFALGWCSLSTR